MTAAVMVLDSYPVGPVEVMRIQRVADVMGQFLSFPPFSVASMLTRGLWRAAAARPYPSVPPPRQASCRVTDRFPKTHIQGTRHGRRPPRSARYCPRYCPGFLFVRSKGHRLGHCQGHCPAECYRLSVFFMSKTAASVAKASGPDAG